MTTDSQFDTEQQSTTWRSDADQYVFLPGEAFPLNLNTEEAAARVLEMHRQLTAQRPSIAAPASWRLVPEFPSEDMLAALEGYGGDEDDDWRTRSNVKWKNLLKVIPTPPSHVAAPTEMAICEISHLVLHVNQPYIFRKHPGCKACENYDITSHVNAGSERPSATRRSGDRRVGAATRRALSDRRVSPSPQESPMRRMIQRRGVWPFGNRGRRESDPENTNRPDGVNVDGGGA